MATLTESKRVVSPAEQRIVLRGIDRATYEALAEQVMRSGQPIRMAYNRGDLELMSPGPLHERYKKLLSRLFEEVLIELDLPFEPLGETRWMKNEAERGLEPDDCYFLTAEKLAIVQGRAPDRPGDPYPDLAIEVELSHWDIDKMAIYAELGIPEVWRYDGADCTIHRLRADGTYEKRSDSLFLPLTPEDVNRWIGRSSGQDAKTWSKQVRAWVRDELARRPR
ncbi:MAG: Uma2 family endonuclease [Planctomycetaceae bacterium]|nr:Uma2 family endonuclease [Planctomycetaceae bacterium]